ncbi:MAG: hypothetical protein ACLRRJ_06620 [Clostridium sp.]
METLNLKPIEKAKIDCARKLPQFLPADVVYDSVDSYQHLLDIMVGHKISMHTRITKYSVHRYD